MTMKAKFVELEVDGLKALVPSLNTLPAMDLIPLMSHQETSTEATFKYTMELLASNMPNELLDDFKTLDIEEMTSLITQWIRKSGEQANEGKGMTNE